MVSYIKVSRWGVYPARNRVWRSTALRGNGATGQRKKSVAITQNIYR